MRTTLTLEPDVARRLKVRMRTADLTLKEAVNLKTAVDLAP
jgi:hypothetical protein